MCPGGTSVTHMMQRGPQNCVILVKTGAEAVSWKITRIMRATTFRNRIRALKDHAGCKLQSLRLGPYLAQHQRLRG